MADLFKLKIVYSTSHLIGPKIVGCILVVLALIMIVQEIVKRKKEGRVVQFEKKKFFIDHYDKVKFWGALVLFIVYIITLKIIGFLIASLIFIFLFNLLFAGINSKKSIMISGIISIVSSFSIWYIFGFLFNITLP